MKLRIPRPGRRRSIRARLALRYAIVAFVTGALLLTFSYVVVQRELAPRVQPGLLSMPSTPAISSVSPAAGTAAPVDLQRRPRSAKGDTIQALPVVPTLSADEVADTEATWASTLKVLEAVQVRDEQVLRSVLLALGGALVLMTLVSAWIGWLLAGRALAPVARITAAARGVTQRNLHERIALDGPHDELRELAETFDAMLDKLDVAFESERQFVANASHELRTPLTVVRTAIDVAEDSGPLDEETRSMVGVIRRALTTADQLVERLLTLARSDRGLDEQAPVPFPRIVEETVEERLGGGRAGDLAVETDVTTDDDAIVSGDAVLLGTLVGNLLDNAVLYNRPGGRLSVRTEREDEQLVLRVENDGQQVDDETLATLLRPFQRAAGRTGQGGFGLGLSIVESIARAHGGTVALEARPAGGLLVTVRLPRAPG